MGTVFYRIIPVTAFAQNCTLLWCETSRDAVIIDPGGEPERIVEAITASDVRPTQILLTHGHIDHVGGALALSRKLALPVVGPQRDDAFLLESLPAQAQMFGLPRVESFTPSRWLADGESIQVGERILSVLHCPGHTPGHVVLVDLDRRIAQVGDVLFAGSIGRTDFPRGDHEALLASIRNRLFPLGDDIRFIPGHGPMSTFGDERRQNPFVADRIV